MCTRKNIRSIRNVGKIVLVVMAVVVKVEVKRGIGGGDVKSRPRNTRFKVLCAVRRSVMEGRGGVFALRGRKEGKCGAGRRRDCATRGRASSSPCSATIYGETDARDTIS